MIAIAPGKAPSTVASAGYTINLSAAATPAFSPEGGTYNGTQTVTITDATSGANIYYTLDGTTPTTQSTLYTGPVAITASATLSAIAAASGYSNSGVESATYTIQSGGGSSPSSPPAITSLSPASATAGGATFTLTVTGTNFTPDATVDWNGTALTTTYVSATQLTAAVSANLIATAGTATVTVTNSAGASSEANFAINASGTGPSSTEPAITSLSPSSAPVGGAPFTLTVNGVNFASGASVNWANTQLTTTYVSATQLTAAVPASLLTEPGAIPITVYSPGGGLSGGGTTTAAVNFTVSSGTPTIASLSPSTALAGGAAFTLAVNGANFASGAVVNWGSTALGTSFVSATQLTASVPANLIATAGTVAITVTTSGGASAAANFSVNTAQLTISSISPYSVSAGGSAFTLTVNGTNFASSGAAVNWGSTALTTTYVSATQLTAAVPANLIATTGSTTITVSEPAGTSPGVTFTVSPPGVPTMTSLSPDTISAGGATFTLTVNGTNFASGAVVNWGSTALTTTYVSATQLTANVPASLIATTGSTTITVSETAGTSGGAPFNVTPPLPMITGTVVSGTGAASVPLGGASVQLYAAGSAGYGQPATAIGSAVTADAQTGAFSVPYDCSALSPPGDLLYLIATGTNTGVTLMTALGPCAGLSSSGTTATINEVTTVASAYSLAQFITAAPNMGAAATNYQGLSNAFATVNNLVNVAIGAALSVTPAYANNAAPFLNTSTAPQMRVNTLANILNSCASTAGSGCASLFSAATPPSGTAPANTLQAILDIAQNPGVNVSTLFGLVPSTPPFSPSLPSAPIDWTLALTFTGGGLGISPTTPATDSAGNSNVGPTLNTSMAIDAAGNIWVTGYGEYGYPAGTNPDIPILAEFSNLGASLTRATTASSATTPVITFGGYNLGQSVGSSNVAPASIAADAGGNIWVGDSSSDGNLYVFSPGLTPLASAVAQGPIYSMAIDNSGYAWIGGGQTPFLGKYMYTAGNTALQAQTLGGAGSAGYQTITDLVFDSGFNLWAADTRNTTVYEISKADGSVAYNAFSSGGNFQISLATDNAGNVYGCGDPAGNILDIFTAAPSTTPATNTLGSRGCGEDLLLDGQGHLFAITNGFGFPIGAAIDEYTTTGTAISPTGGYTGTSSAEPATITADNTFSNGFSFETTTAGIDSSGNLWLINLTTSNSGGTAGNGAGTASGTGNVLVEFVGIAAPVVTSTAAALTNGQLGTRP